MVGFSFKTEIVADFYRYHWLKRLANLEYIAKSHPEDQLVICDLGLTFSECCSVGEILKSSMKETVR